MSTQPPSQPPEGEGTPPSYEPAPPPPYDQPAYGQQNPSEPLRDDQAQPYGQQPPPPPSYGEQLPSYGEQPPAHGEPPSYGQQAQQPPAYGDQPVQYGGTPAPGYGQQPAYGQPAYAGQPYGAGPGTPYGFDPQGRPYSDKSKVVAGVLGILLGFFGAGRWYTGHYGIATAQLIVSVVTCGIGSLWGLIDGILMLVGEPTDSQGRPLRS